MNQQFMFIILALLAGAMIPFQSAMNSTLGKHLQSPYFSALSVFIIAALGLAIYIILSWHAVPTMDQIITAPKWSYLGGVLGGIYILLIIILAPRLGIGPVTVMVLAGQLLAAMIIDHFGLLGAASHPITLIRILGILLVFGGVYLIKRF